MLQAAVIVKAMIEVAIFAFLGQGILYVLAGSKRNTNFVYAMLKAITSPVFKVARWVSPRFILDQHMWLVAMFLLILAWVAATAWKVRAVLGGG